MTKQEVLLALEGFGNEQTKKIYMNHGAPEPLWGVKVADLKKIQKKIKKNHQLALDLYETGNSDAMYLAGLIADEKQMTPADLQKWVEKATWYYLSEYAVAWLAAESNYGWELALEWMQSPIEKIAASGWATLSSLVVITSDKELDLVQLEQQLNVVAASVHSAPNRVRYTMNGFLIAVGTSVKSLSAKAQAIAKQVGKVSVNLGNTACKVPLASVSIQKVWDANKLGYKKSKARC